MKVKNISQKTPIVIGGVFIRQGMSREIDDKVWNKFISSNAGKKIQKLYLDVEIEPKVAVTKKPKTEPKAKTGK